MTEEQNSKLAALLARELAAMAPEEKEARLEFVASFVQGALPYVSEEGEYPKYPAETLVEGGDCEDKSILLAALLRALGYKVALLVFDGDPGHMAVGVDCPGCRGAYYLHDGVKYFYLETTQPGWAPGEVPPEFVGARARLYPVS